MARQASKAAFVKRVYPRDTARTPDDVEAQEHHAPELERRLLRRALRRMSARRWQCSQCGRSPLVGECLQVFEAREGERHLCQLCLSAAPEGSLGEPLRSERVGAVERGLNVRRAA